MGGTRGREGASSRDACWEQLPGCRIVWDTGWGMEGRFTFEISQELGSVLFSCL